MLYIQESLDIFTPCVIGMKPFLEFSMSNLFVMVFMYMDRGNPSNLLDLSLYISIPSIYVAFIKSFIEKFFDSHTLID